MRSGSPMCKFSVTVCLIASPLGSAMSLFLSWAHSSHLSQSYQKKTDKFRSLLQNMSSGNQSVKDFS